MLVGSAGTIGPVPTAKRGATWTAWKGLWAFRPVHVVVAAAVLALVIGGTFPSWAGAVADWPLVGPVVTRIVMKDAGLKWAYDNGLIQNVLAQTRDGEAVLKVLGVMADPLRTTVIYQLSGVPGPTAQPETASDSTSARDPVGTSAGVPAPTKALTQAPAQTPATASGSVIQLPTAPTADSWPSVAIASIDGKGAASWQQAPVWTPLGWVGAVSTYPLLKDSAQLGLEVQSGDHRMSLSFGASKVEASRFSREVKASAGSSQSVGGVTVTLDSVIYSPAETLVRYVVQKPMFSGSYSTSGTDLSHYLEVAGRRLDPVRVNGLWSADGSAAITLTGVDRSGDHIGVRWSYPKNDRFVGLAGFDVVDGESRTGWQHSHLRGVLHSHERAPLDVGSGLVRKADRV